MAREETWPQTGQQALVPTAVTTSVIVSPSVATSSRWRASASGTNVFAIGPTSRVTGGRAASPAQEYAPPRVPRHQMIGRARRL